MKKETNSTIGFSIDQLKSIREKKNMTVESLSDILKISKAFIDYIENGQFEKLGAPTFIKGHVTNYCKALNLDTNAVIQQIPEHFLQSQNIKPSDAFGASPLARVKQNSNHLGKYAIGTALLAMLALSFFFVWDKWSVPTGLAQEQTAFTTLVDKNDKDTATQGKNITYSSLIPQVSLDAKPTNAESEAETIDNGITETPDLTTVPLEANDEQTQDESTEELSTVAAMATFSIELQLDDQAWVSIKTNDGEKLVHDLMGPGVHQYQTNQSLHFRIGNATNARVMINDEPVDFTAFLKQDIADFKWPIDPS
jgi:cytoskeletal protein RodZ